MLLLVGVAYLGLLFVVAEAAERSVLVRSRLVKHPLVYSLSLCVYATSWTFFGSVGYARDHGYGYAAIGLGVMLSCLLVPLVWRRVLRVVRERQLSSVADLFAYRYGSRGLGLVVTLLLVAGSLPYLALQFRAVTEAMSALSGDVHVRAGVGGIYLGVVTLFALLFGIRHDVARRQHPGLIAAIALESLVKLVAIVVVVAAAVSGVFGGMSGLNAWVEAHPEALERLYEPVRSGAWVTLLVLAMSAAFLLPRQFHMAFTECTNEKALDHAMWLFPALMLLFYGGTPILLWAGTVIAPNLDPDLYVLAIASRWPSVALLVFIGGLSASSAMIIVTSLALSAMLLNHAVVPVALRSVRRDLYRDLRWARRLLVLTVTGAGYVVFEALDYRGGLVELGLTAFVAVAQLLPGLAGVIFWRGATRGGILAGLILGSLTWAFLMLPVLFWPSWDPGHWLAPGVPLWATCTYASLGLNASAAIGLSLAFPQARSGREAEGPGTEHDLNTLHERLSPLLGAAATTLELRRALSDLGMSAESLTHEDFCRLSGRVERNLTGLIGPLMASTLVGSAGRDPSMSDLAELVSSLHVSGQKAEDLVPKGPVRAILERVMDELPVGVCALDEARRVVMWNQRLVQLTGLSCERALGVDVRELPPPWSEITCAVLRQAVANGQGTLETVVKEQRFGVTRCNGSAEDGVTVLMLEDLSERHRLEARLAHHERLASLGRLSAAVAHEIGNPLTGLLMVAQNLQNDVDDADVRDRLAVIVREARRVQGILESLEDFSRSGSDTPTEAMRLDLVSIQTLFQDALDLVSLNGRARHVTFALSGSLEERVECDPRRLAQVITNLVTNACDASDPGGRVELSARTQGGAIELDVMDAGHGIPAAHLERVFEPFFTRSRSGGGTGLGLAVARSIVREHRGTLDVVETGATGTRIRVRLPILQAPAAAFVHIGTPNLSEPARA